MRLVLAHRPGAALSALRALESQEEAALVAQWREGLEAPWLSGWLDQLAEEHLWIACDCRAPHEPPPLAFVRQAPGGQHVLARMPDRPPHAPGCPLAAAPRRAVARDAPAKLSELPELLCRWFGAARLNVVFPYEAEDTLSHQYAALRELSRSLNLAPGRRLYDFSRTHPQGLPELFRRLARARPDEHAGGGATGVYLTVVSTLERIELPAVDDAPARIEEDAPEASSVIEQLEGVTPTAGPFVLLIELAATPHGPIGIRRVYAHPVYSHRLLVPVRNTRERRTLRVLLDVQRALLSGHRRLISIRKTLPDAPIYERGIAFQVQQLGPNGRAVRAVDVVSVDAVRADQDGLADGERLATCEGALAEIPGDTLYHCVDAADGPFTIEEQRFRRRLMSCFLASWRTLRRAGGAEPRG